MILNKFISCFLFLICSLDVFSQGNLDSLFPTPRLVRLPESPTDQTDLRDIGFPALHTPDVVVSPYWRNFWERNACILAARGFAYQPVLPVVHAPDAPIVVQRFLVDAAGAPAVAAQAADIEDAGTTMSARIKKRRRSPASSDEMAYADTRRVSLVEGHAADIEARDIEADGAGVPVARSATRTSRNARTPLTEVPAHERSVPVGSASSMTGFKYDRTTTLAAWVIKCLIQTQKSPLTMSDITNIPLQDVLNTIEIGRNRGLFLDTLSLIDFYYELHDAGIEIPFRSASQWISAYRGAVIMHKDRVKTLERAILNSRMYFDRGPLNDDEYMQVDKIFNLAIIHRIHYEEFNNLSQFYQTIVKAYKLRTILPFSVWIEYLRRALAHQQI